MMENIPRLVKGNSTFSKTSVPDALASLATTSKTFSMLKKAGLRLRYMRVTLMLKGLRGLKELKGLKQLGRSFNQS